MTVSRLEYVGMIKVTEHVSRESKKSNTPHDAGGLSFRWTTNCHLRTKALLDCENDSELGLLQSVDVEAKLQRRPELQSEVLHDHVTLQEQQSVSIDLLREAEKVLHQNESLWTGDSRVKRREQSTHVFPEDICVRTESLGVCIPDEPNHILHRPGGWVLTGWSLGLLGLWRDIVATWQNQNMFYFSKKVE